MKIQDLEGTTLPVDSNMRQLRKAVRRTKRSARWETFRTNPATPAWVVTTIVQLVWALIASGVLALVVGSGLSAQGRIAGTLFTIGGLVGLSIPTWVIGTQLANDLKNKTH